MKFISLSCFPFSVIANNRATDPDLVFGGAWVFVRRLRIITTGLSPHLHVLHGPLGVRGGRGYLIQLLLEHLLGLFLIFLQKSVPLLYTQKWLKYDTSTIVHSKLLIFLQQTVPSLSNKLLYTI